MGTADPGDCVVSLKSTATPELKLIITLDSVGPLVIIPTIYD